MSRVELQFAGSGTGPARLSGAERAAVIAEITGRPLAFRVITEEQLRAGLTQAGLPAGAINTVVSTRRASTQAHSTS